LLFSIGVRGMRRRRVCDLDEQALPVLGVDRSYCRGGGGGSNALTIFHVPSKALRIGVGFPSFAADGSAVCGDTGCSSTSGGGASHAW
jgi:hypothetical protein